MSRSVGHDWGGRDGWAEGLRLERKARPAGRVAKLVAEEMVAEGDPMSDDEWIAFLIGHDLGIAGVAV